MPFRARETGEPRDLGVIPDPLAVPATGLATFGWLPREDRRTGPV